MINGNIDGIRDSLFNEIESLYEYIIPKDSVISKEVAELLADFTSKVNREISIYIDRKGRIVDISLGNQFSVELSEMSTRRSDKGLCGIRCIHTHPNGNGELSAVDISALIDLKLDAIASIGVSDKTISNMYCVILEINNGVITGDTIKFGPFTISEIEAQNVMQDINENYKKLDVFSNVENKEYFEKAILVGVQTNENDINETNDESLDELEKLVETVGGKCVHKILQHRSKIDTAFYIGKGKAEEISLLRQSLNANIVVFDDELSGVQIRNLESVTGVKVIDRTTLILDIFARHASSKEGKIQVELAQLKYRLPRLTGLGTVLSRLGGGIGTRGPGEKKLETDKRHINRRILYLEKELREIKKHRELQRTQRTKSNIPTVALVGYTNSGKSTLMNALCNAGVLAENKLFATLDSTVRKMTLENGQDILLIDTVGFIRKLPHHLVEAFKSTLEETVHSDVLLHVIDSSSKEYGLQREIVIKLLEKLNATNKPIISVYNKVDLVHDEIIPCAGEDYVKISAKNYFGLNDLLEELLKHLPQSFIKVEWLIPYSKGFIVSLIHEKGKVVEEEYINEGIRISAYVDVELFNKYNNNLI